MKKPPTTRDCLIEEGLRAFLANGYDGIGLEGILRAKKVPKGSFYHFFRSKEDFACAVVEAYSKHYTAVRAALFSNTNESPSARLRRYFELLERELSQSLPAGGCLLGMLACTAGNRGPAVLKRLEKSFKGWEDSLGGVIAEGQQVGDIASGRDARIIAAILIDAYEGALVRVRASGKLAPFKRFMKDVLEPMLTSGTAYAAADS